MTEPKTHVVFKAFSTILAVMDVADDHGWEEVQRFKRGERQLEEFVYELPDGETVVRGIVDHFVAITFAVITGPGREDAERKLRSGGNAIDDATLWQWVKSEDPEQRSFALRAFAAISQPVADLRVVDAYQAAVRDPDTKVRQALIDSIGRTAWRELWPVVDELAKSGDETATTLRESYQRHLPRA